MQVNRLSQCIEKHVSTLSASDVSESAASSIRSIVRERLYQQTEEHVRDWLNQVSSIYVIEFPYLEQDWDRYNTLSRKTKLADRMDEDEMDDNQDPQKRYKGNDICSNKEDEIEMERKIYPRLVAAINRYVHESTGMVFISPSELKVFARWDGEALHPLDSDDQEVCRVMRFHTAPERYEEIMSVYPIHLRPRPETVSMSSSAGSSS